VAELTTGAFLIAKVEIFALKGTLPEAESALEDAEKFDQKHPRAAMSWSLSGAPLPTARAFIMEKKGNLDGAAAAYNSILVDIKKTGWPDAFNVIHGRLAIVSLMKGDEAAAEGGCKDSLLNDPAANAARGALLRHARRQAVLCGCTKANERCRKQNELVSANIFRRAKAGKGRFKQIELT
jgi:hypothetical protein